MKVAVWIGVLAGLVVAAAVFLLIASSVYADARDLATQLGWWALVALAFPATIGVLAYISD